MSIQSNSPEANLNTPDHPRHRRMLEPLISLYQDGEASPAEQRTVERYLATCAECRRLLTGYKQVETQLRTYLEKVPEPKPLRPFSQNTQAMLSGEHQNKLPEINGSLTSPPDRTHRFTPVMAGRVGGVVAAMLVLVSLLTVVLIYRSNDTASQVPTAVVAVYVGTAEPSATPSPSPSATPSPTEQPSPIALPTEQPLATALPAVEPSHTILAPVTQSVTGNNPIATATTRPAPPVPTNTFKTVPTLSPTPSATATSGLVASVPITTTAALMVATTSALTSPPITATVSTIDTSVPITATTTVTTTDTPDSATSTLPVSTFTPKPTDNTTTPVPTTHTTATAVPITRSVTPNPTLAPLTVKVPGWIAYVNSQDGEIHLITSDGGTDVTLSKDSGEKWQELIWSHDAKWIAAVAQNSTSGGHAIYIFNVNERNVSQLNFVAEGFAPVWSPNDLSMAFLAGPIKTKDGLEMGKPSVVNLKKRFVQSPVPLSDEYQALSPQWFEDGNRLLVGHNLIVATDGTLLTTLTLPYQNTCVAPSLSPFGNKLAVMEQDGPVIYDLNKNTLDKNKPLSRPSVNISGKVGNLCGAYRLRWTPSGRSIYFYVNNGGVDTTCVVSAGNAGASCLFGVYEPGFTIDGGDLVDYNPNLRGQFYAMEFGNKPANPRILGLSKVPPVWEPRWN